MTALATDLEKLGKDFINKYYDAMDKRRLGLATLYAESGVCVWNGQMLNSKIEIMEFMNNLPMSKHECTMLDAQQVDAVDVEDPERQYLVIVGGNVSFNGNEDSEFQQTFFINELNNQLLIVNDTYRLYE